MPFVNPETGERLETSGVIFRGHESCDPDTCSVACARLLVEEMVKHVALAPNILDPGVFDLPAFLKSIDVTNKSAVAWAMFHCGLLHYFSERLQEAMEGKGPYPIKVQ